MLISDNEFKKIVPVGKLANLNASLYGHKTRQERCPCSRLEVREIAHRYHQSFLNGEENAKCTEAPLGDVSANFRVA
jgi:hypothetical protein